MSVQRSIRQSRRDLRQERLEEDGPIILGSKGDLLLSATDSSPALWEGPGRPVSSANVVVSDVIGGDKGSK